MEIPERIQRDEAEYVRTDIVESERGDDYTVQDMKKELEHSHGGKMEFNTLELVEPLQKRLYKTEKSQLSLMD